MNSARRTPPQRRSPARVAAQPPKHNGPPGDSKASTRTAAEWEARLCELELRLTHAEMENRRLREAYQQLEALSASRARLQDVAPVGLVTLDPRGTILDLNRTAATMVASQKTHLIGRPFTFLIQSGDIPRFLNHLQRCRTGKPKPASPPDINANIAGRKFQIPQPRVESPRPLSIELRLRGNTGLPLIVQLATAVVRDERSRVVQLETTLIDITERKQAEAALRTSEENLRILIEAAPHPIQFEDADGRWQLANKAALELFDLVGVDYRNKRNTELADHAAFYRDILIARERKDREVVKAGEVTRTDEIVPKPDGTARILDVIRVPLRHGDGRAKGLVVLGYDITARELAHEALRAREAELRLITDITPIMLTRCTRDLRFAFVNSTYAEFLGLTPEQIVGRSISEVLGDDAFEIIQPYVEQVLRGEGVEFEAEVPYRRKGRRFMEVAYRPDHDEHGNVVGWIAAITDITERRRGEETLRQSEDRFRTLASHAPVGIFMSDSNGDAVYVNQSWSDMTGIALDEAQGRDWIKAVHPQDRERVAFGWDDAIKRRDNSSAEFRFLRPDSSVIWVHGQAVQLRDADGLVVGYIGTVADITERRQAERRQAVNLAVTHVLAESPVLGDATFSILRTICKTLGWEIGGIWMPDPKANVLRCLQVWHDPETKADAFVSASHEMTLAPGIGLAGRVWKSRRPAWIPDVTKDDNFPRAAAAASVGVRAAFGFPIRSGEKFLAMMDFFSRECLEPDNALLEMFGGIGNQIGQFIERKRAEEALRHTKEELAAVNESLENRVKERTAELTHANEVLQEEIAERKRSELARFRLMGIVESSADAILTKTLRGTITGWNKGAERMFGYAEHEIIGRSISAIIPPGREDELAQSLAVLRGGEAVQSIDTVRMRKDGRMIDVSLTLSPISDETGTVRAASAIMRDITDRKRAEQLLGESQARLQAIMDNSPAMIFLKDAQGRYLHFNRQFAQAFRLRLEDCVGKTDADLFLPKQAAAFRANDLAVLEGGIPTVFDEVAMHEDGPHTSIVTKSPLFDADGKPYAIVGIVTDITERKRLEEEVLHISEREHRRIAQDLHDGLGQQLAGISCLSNVLKKNLSDSGSPEAATALRISKLLDAAVAQTRGLARGLHPVEPEPTGLMSALQELAASITELFKVSCEFECSQPVPIVDNAMATHLYRIAQEAATNALKHGRARKIKIGLSATPERIILAVGDDGAGFNKKTAKKKGLGLRIMSYRAGMIGGTLVVQKKPNSGTDVICTVEKPTASKPPSDNGQTIAKAKRTKTNLHRG